MFSRHHSITARHLRRYNSKRRPKSRNKKQVFAPELAPKITTLISSVGFYQNTGDWLYTSGIPAKSGVGGGVLGVMPGVMGIAAFAPPLDEAGNSVKAQAAVKAVMKKLGLGIFNGDRVTVTA